MTAIARTRKARVQHLCSTRAFMAGCARLIQPGELYRSVALTPDHEGLTGPRWQHLSECMACAAYYLRDDDRPPIHGYGHEPTD